MGRRAQLAAAHSHAALSELYAWCPPDHDWGDVCDAVGGPLDDLPGLHDPASEAVSEEEWLATIAEHQAAERLAAEARMAVLRLAIERTLV